MRHRHEATLLNTYDVRIKYISRTWCILSLSCCYMVACISWTKIHDFHQNKCGNVIIRFLFYSLSIVREERGNEKIPKMMTGMLTTLFSFKVLLICVLCALCSSLMLLLLLRRVLLYTLLHSPVRSLYVCDFRVRDTISNATTLYIKL